MLAENMMMAFNAIRANKLRSVLTMLGIIEYTHTYKRYRMYTLYFQ